jgi:lipopolysaccharide/colanic/teichoic acid biosynthesis glycosyltransferase
MKYVIKRFFDIALSVLGLFVLSPVFLIISIAIKIDSKGPVFFCQERLTKNGKPFKMIKFRTMIVNAEKMGAGLFNYENDPRVTKIGRWLRKFSCDELPQFINVLIGDMTIVGPRPPVIYELGEYDTLNPRYKKRFTVKGGITGLAQIKGRNSIDWDKKVYLDNQYIELFNKYGVLIDIKILFYTVINVFMCKDIYEVKIREDMDNEESARAAEVQLFAMAQISKPEEKMVIAK